jgi:hypothetical protein
MNKSMVVKISTETLVYIFAAIVKADNSELGRKLSLDHRMERLKDREYLVFIFHQIEPCHAGTIIKKKKITNQRIPETIEIGEGPHTSEWTSVNGILLLLKIGK